MALSKAISNILLLSYRVAQPPERDMIIDLLERALLAAEQGNDKRAKALMLSALNVAEGKVVIGYLQPQ